MGHSGFNGWWYPLPFIPYHDYAWRAEFGIRDAIAIKKRPIDSRRMHGCNGVDQIAIMQAHTWYGAHGRLDDFWAETVSGLRGAYYVSDTKPIWHTDYSAEIPWILYGVKCQHKVGGCCIIIEFPLR